MNAQACRFRFSSPLDSVLDRQIDCKSLSPVPCEDMRLPYLIISLITKCYYRLLPAEV